MSLYDRSNVVYFKRPITLFDFGSKAPGRAASGNRNSERGIVISFPGRRVAEKPAIPVQSHPGKASAKFPAMSAECSNTPTGWPCRNTSAQDSGAPPANRAAKARLAARDRQAIERGENEGMLIEPV